MSAETIQNLQTLVQQNKLKQAILSGNKLLAQQPQSAHAMFLTAYAYQMNGENDKAEALYRQIIAQYPLLPEPHNNLAMIYQERGDYDEASRLLVDAIETHKSYATAYQNLSRIYTGIASEAYRRALSESVEPATYTHKIELSALTGLSLPAEVDIVENKPALPTPKSDRFNDVAKQLQSHVVSWAKSWSSKDFATYSSFYSSNHRPNFNTHSEWLDYRRQRILRPGAIRVKVDNIQIRAQTEKQAIIDFNQSFDSPSYSDRVRKRLGFRLIGGEWKIVEERVLSVL